MMIAIAIAGALVVYAWVMGYIDLSNEKAGEMIEIQSIFNDGGDLLVYVQNVGEGAVQLDEEGCLYINDVLVECSITNVAVSDKIATLGQGETATLRYVGGAAPPGEKVEVKVTTVQGTQAQKVDYPAGITQGPPVLDHFEFSTISSPQTSGTAFTVTIQAVDQYDKRFTEYNNVNTLTCSGGTINPSTTGSFTNGVWTGEVTVTEASTTATITTVSQVNASWMGTSNSFAVNEKPPATMWNRTYGSEDYERAWSVAKTADGGYVIAGEANYTDFWVVKTTSDGTMEWNLTYETVTKCVAHSLIQTSDMGYAVVGEAINDFFLVKITPNGTLEWNKTYDGGATDVARSVIQTSDGGYVIAGRTGWGAGNWDGWVVKTNSEGTIEWEKKYGGSRDDLLYAVVKTENGGYAVAGYTTSYGAGLDDCWLVKINSNGEQEWEKTYGGTNDDCAFALVTTSDGGYALTGSTVSFGAGQKDFWLIKTDASGNEVWNQTYGGVGINDHEIATALVVTQDGGYAIAGYTNSLDAGGNDFWLVKTDATGNADWNQTYIGAGNNMAQSLVATSDGGYAIVGNVQSSDDPSADYDFWLVKTDEHGNTQ